MGGAGGRVAAGGNWSETAANWLRSLVARPVPALASILGLALGVRLLALWVSLETPLAGDEPEYFARAARWGLGPPLSEQTARAPGAIFLYASFFQLFGVSVVTAKLANVLVSALTVWPAYWIGRAAGGAAVGALAALGVALYPNYIAFSHFLWPEPLYIFLLASGIALLLVDGGRPSWARILGAGGLLGLSALCKESGVLFLPVAAAWLAWRGWASEPRAALRRGACLLIVSLAVIAPRVAQVNRPGEAFALITRTGAMNLFVGNHPISHGHGMREYQDLAPTALASERLARARALAEIERRLPLWPLEKIGLEGPRFFTPTSFAIRRLLAPVDRPGGWRYRLSLPGGESAGLRAFLVAGVVSSYLAVLLAGTAGWILTSRRELAMLALLFILAQIVPSLLTFSMSRFRLPSMLFFLIGSALWAVRGREDWAGASPLRRTAAVAGVLGLLAIVALDYSAVLSSTGR